MAEPTRDASPIHMLIHISEDSLWKTHIGANIQETNIVSDDRDPQSSSFDSTFLNRCRSDYDAARGLQQSTPEALNTILQHRVSLLESNNETLVENIQAFVSACYVVAKKVDAAGDQIAD